MALSAAQSAALEHVTQRARSRAQQARQKIEHILQMSNIASGDLEQAISQLETHARVALHFHPDRPGREGRSVAAALLAEGIYRSQFETGISNGGLSAHPGGDRQQWESQLFGHAYDRPRSDPTERPKYGALDVMIHPDGPSPRFGSCYFLLTPNVSRRCTFTYLDSHRNPVVRGTYQAFDDIVGAPLEDAFTNDFALGERDLTPMRLVDHLGTRLSEPLIDPSTRLPHRNLDHYIEAQVHGEISLCKDVDVLVADPSFVETDVGDELQILCNRYDIALYWHAGFALALNDIPSDFRGETMPSLAKRISTGRHVDVSMIGQAAISLRRAPQPWSDRGTYDEVLQELKLLWHVLVRHGHPLREFER